MCGICVITAKGHSEDPNEDVYQEKGQEGKLRYRQEISVDILNAVGKQTLRVLKSLGVTEMPHNYAKYKSVLKLLTGSTEVCVLKPHVNQALA